MKRTIQEEQKRIINMMRTINEQYWDDDRGDAEDFERESLRNDNEYEGEEGDEYEVSDEYRAKELKDNFFQKITATVQDFGRNNLPQDDMVGLLQSAIKMITQNNLGHRR